MSDLDRDLLEAIPAYARQLLVVGPDLLRHRELWEQRNPLAKLATEVPANGEKLEAILLSLDSIGSDAASTILHCAAHLAPGGTLALFGDAWGKAATPGLAELLHGQGLVPERLIGGATADGHGILRFQRRDAPVRELRILANPFAFDADPMRQSVVRVRLREPMEQLSSIPGVRCQVGTKHSIQPVTEPDAANILIFQRFLFDDPATVRRATRGQRYITIAELDDEPGRFIKTTPEYTRNTLARHHAVQTSSAELADYVRQFNPEVAVFGNHLTRIRPYAPKTSSDSVRILFAAVNRESGWREIIEAYRAIVAGHGERIKTIVVGDQKFFDELQPLNSEFHPTMPYPDYVAELERSDIALLPLANTSFDRKKTDLKFIECAEAGSAVLASNVLYAASIRPGKTGMLYRNADEFRRHLRTLIDEPAKRRGLAEAAHRYVREQRALANHIRRQHEWYLSLVERRDALEQAICDRVGPD